VTLSSLYDTVTVADVGAACLAAFVRLSTTT
jgi:hypothetical protein